ncbi:MAG: kelch repeat-containing protein [Planctomycetota bacterium]
MNTDRLPFLLSCLLLSSFSSAQYYYRDGGTQPGLGGKVAYDAGRDRTVCFAGPQGTWEHDGLTWSQVPNANTPVDRYEFDMKAAFGGIYMYGGQDTTSSNFLSDLQVFNGGQWQAFPQLGPWPGPRRGHALAFDPVRGRLVLFGGGVGNVTGPVTNDTWEFDGANWSLIQTPNRPPARVWHCMEYDPSRGAIVMHGGANNPSVFTDTWTYNGQDWTPIANGGGPTRFLASMVYDTVQQRVMMLGGQSGASQTLLGDVFLDSSGLWMVLNAANGTGAQATWDTLRSRGVSVGGGTTEASTWFLETTGSLTASTTQFGAGCSSPPISIGGRPPMPGPPVRLDALQGCRAVQGVTYRMVLNQVAQPTAAFLMFGLSNTQWGGGALPFALASVGMPGCTLYVDPMAAAPVTITPSAIGQGGGDFRLPIPIMPSVAGVTFYNQGLLLDPTHANGIGHTTNGLSTVVQ